MTDKQALKPPLLKEMLAFADLERVLLSACSTTASRIAVSHYVRWMSALARNWSDDELLLELLAVIVIAAELPTPETGTHSTFVSSWAPDVCAPQRGGGQIMP